MSMYASKRLGTFACQSCRGLRRQNQRRFASTSPDTYDVVAVGGGPAGLALLAALKSSPKTSHLRAALIESQDLSKQQQWMLPSDQFSNRASSLTPSSVGFLEASGTWDLVAQSRTQPYNEMKVWDASNNASIDFDWKAEAVRYNAPPRTVATMTENANLTMALLRRIEELGAMDCLLPNTRVSSIEMGKDDPEGLDLSNWPILSLDSTNTSNNSRNQRSIAARLLVGADGFNSPVRSFAGINSYGWDYGRHGVVGTLKVTRPEWLEESGAFVAYQRFLPRFGGPIAILPLPENHASLVWSTTPERATYLKSLQPSALSAMINAALRLTETDIQFMFGIDPSDSGKHEFELNWRLEHGSNNSEIPNLPVVDSIQQGSVASFPLRFRHATTLTAPRIALIGDAAHTVHPLAGQGLNLGLADARALTDTIVYSVEHGMDIGDSMALERYNSERFGKGLLMAGGVDALNWIYQIGAGDGIVSSALSSARGIGMKIFGSDVVEQSGLKGQIMKMAERS